jgi:hypothetical protein
MCHVPYTLCVFTLIPSLVLTPRPFNAQFIVDLVLHSDCHLDRTNLSKTLKRSCVTSTTSVSLHHPQLLSVHSVTNPPLLAHPFLPLILGPILRLRPGPSSYSDNSSPFIAHPKCSFIVRRYILPLHLAATFDWFGRPFLFSSARSMSPSGIVILP